jgi:hypothetical protein
LRDGRGGGDAVRYERRDGGFDVGAGGVGRGVERGGVSNVKGVVGRRGFGFGWKSDGGDGGGGGSGGGAGDGGGGGSGEGSDGGGGGSSSGGGGSSSALRRIASANILSYLIISGVEACARSGALAPRLNRGCRVRQLVPSTLSPLARPFGTGAPALGASGLGA